MKIKVAFLVFLFMLMPALSLFSQKVALVLSGGGAKAFSHIGVLRALEENNIPIDFVVGNSMGAMIAGMYASGYCPEEIKYMLSDPALYNFRRGNEKSDRFVFQQINDDASWVTIPFKIENKLKISMPFNVFNIQDLDFLVMDFFAGPSAAAGYNFDSLMVPFRCVATDIDSSRMVLMKEGELAKAVRASITFPFFIRPIRIEDVLLFDGGMYDNFPVDVAINEFSPDFIIGSKAVRNFPSPDEDDVISQMQNMLMQKANFNFDSINGILIESNFGAENIFHFEKIEQYIDSGYAATMRMMPEIKEKIGRRQNLAELSLKRAAFIIKQPATDISKVTIKGVNMKQESYIKGSIHFEKDGELNPVEFEKQYTRLLANENIREAYPSMHYNDTTQKFDITLDVRTEDPLKLKFGGYISSSGVNTAFISLGYQHLSKTSARVSVNAYFGTFYNSIYGMGKIEFQHNVPIFLMLDALASRTNYFANSRYFYDDLSPAYIIQNENYLNFNIGTPIGLSEILRTGLANLNLSYTYYPDNYFTRNDTADQSSFYFLNPYLEFERNNLNRKKYASKGSYFLLAANYYIGSEHTTPGTKSLGAEEFEMDRNFIVLTSHFEQYLSVFKPFILGFSGNVVYSNRPLLSNYISSLLIASPYQPINMMKTLFLENYRAYSYGAVGLKTIFNLYKNLDLRLEGYFFMPYQKILREETRSGVYFGKPFSYNYQAATVEIVYHSPIGPIGVSGNYFDQDGAKFLFLFNIGYLIFNESRFYR